MTLLESPVAAPDRTDTSDPVDPRARKAARTAATNRTLRIAVIALALLIVSVGVFMLFDGPIANAWYSNRQHQLASQWQAQRPHVGAGHAVALIQVPSLHVTVLVADGDSPQQLRSGPGHRIGTPMPGDVGNSVIVGHRSAWGGPFSKLDQVTTGTLIAVQTKGSSGAIGVFTVVSVRHVSANDLSPFVGSTDHRVTIVTGTGGRYSDRRLVITAVSGTVGHTTTVAGPATTPGGSAIWNAYVGLAVLALAVALALGALMRRRYRVFSIALAAAPFVVLAVLLLLLNVDTLLPALR